jgi:hypothetical protein
MELCFGQKIDESNGLVMPWFTHGALDEMSKMDLTDKVVVMFGAGMGDRWLANRCRMLYVIERNQEWLTKAMQQTTDVCNIQYLFRPCNEGSGAQDMYCELPNDNIGVIINDDAYRTEVCQVAVDYFNGKKGGILICDNWKQSYVWISPKAEETMSPFRAKIFEQSDHTDNDGINKWKTAIFYL